MVPELSLLHHTVKWVYKLSVPGKGSAMLAIVAAVLVWYLSEEGVLIILLWL